MRTRHVVIVLISMVVFLFGCAGNNIKTGGKWPRSASFKLGEGEANSIHAAIHIWL